MASKKRKIASETKSLEKEELDELTLALMGPPKTRLQKLEDECEEAVCSAESKYIEANFKAQDACPECKKQGFSVYRGMFSPLKCENKHIWLAHSNKLIKPTDPAANDCSRRSYYGDALCDKLDDIVIKTRAAFWQAEARKITEKKVSS